MPTVAQTWGPPVGHSPCTTAAARSASAKTFRCGPGSLVAVAGQALVGGAQLVGGDGAHGVLLFALGVRLRWWIGWRPSW